jgi:hypothetical protein
MLINHVLNQLNLSWDMKYLKHNSYNKNITGHFVSKKISPEENTQPSGRWRLFKDVFSSSHCTMSDGRIINQQQIGKGRMKRRSQGYWGGRGMWQAWGRREHYTRFWWESQKENDHSEDQGVGGRTGSELILGRLAWGVWIGFDWLRIVTGGGVLWVRWWTFGILRHGVNYKEVAVALLL